MIYIHTCPCVCCSSERCLCVGAGPTCLPDHHDEDRPTATGGKHPLPQKVNYTEKENPKSIWGLYIKSYLFILKRNKLYTCVK